METLIYASWAAASVFWTVVFFGIIRKRPDPQLPFRPEETEYIPPPA